MYKGLNGDLVFSNDMFATAQTLTQSGNADGNGGSLEVSDTQNSVNIVVRANTTITILATKKMTVSLLDSANDSTFAALSTIIVVTGVAGGTVYAAGTIIAEVILPANAKRYTKVNVANDGLNTGKFDIYPVIAPR